MGNNRAMNELEYDRMLVQSKQYGFIARFILSGLFLIAAVGLFCLSYWMALNGFGPFMVLPFLLSFVLLVPALILLIRAIVCCVRRHKAAVAVREYNLRNPKPILLDEYTDPVERLTKAKALLDAGIISQEEFDRIKSECIF